eukprot:TRINITY_DN1569_c0_g1_i3.p1 TRINITY_DN1569_c0_g1~~TRINITY_DN1569_c0_g1_i3.p1  ORF type:complete len:539 (-),score=95.99 TRINITY_DN1569_c0_g1_i3:34-1650(-)
MGTRVNNKEPSNKEKKKGNNDNDLNASSTNVSSALSITTQVVFTAIVCAIVLQISPYYLEPIFGNVLPYYNFQLSCFLSFFVGFLLGYSSSSSRFGFISAVDFISIVIAFVPLSVNYLFTFSSSFGPLMGPHLTQLAFAYPIFFALGSLNATLCKTYTSQTQPNKQILYSVLILSSNYILIQLINNNFVSNKSCRFSFFIVVVLTLISLVLKMLKPLSSTARTNLWRFFLPQFLVILLNFYNTNYNIRCQDKLTPAHNANTLDYKILVRAHSVTGWLSVVEDTKRNFLAMRSDHSFIGGKYKDSDESIFTSFYLMEIAFLVSRSQSDQQEKALQIGVGCGITTNEVLRRNITLDAVEIDPVVYFFARGYFNLTVGGNIYFKDGREFMDSAKDSEYDYIFHDVFTGGSVPAKLFSYEAVKEMKRILKPDGVLSMNFVGSSHEKHRTSLDFVATTLSSHFAHVVCFSDNSNEHTSSTTKRQPIFGNFLFLASSQPITFRKPTESDFSGSYSRKFIFKHFICFNVHTLLNFGFGLQSGAWS